MLAGVALLAEGVGRNQGLDGSGRVVNVALLAEGVGRNPADQLPPGNAYVSPSSRRAWVKIRLDTALAQIIRSPSSRRAWVEIV